MYEIDTVKALLDNGATDRELFETGRGSRTVDCEISPLCVIQTRAGQEHGGPCIGAEVWQVLEKLYAREGEELIGVIP